MRQAARDEADEAEDPDRFLREQEEASDESGRRRKTKGRGRGGKGRGRGKAKAEPKVRSHTGKDMKEDSGREDVDEPDEGNHPRNAQKAQKKNQNNDESKTRAPKNATPKTKRNRKDAMSPKVADSPFLKRAKSNREREREEKKIDRQASQPTTDGDPKPKRRARTRLARQLEADFASVAGESADERGKPASPAETPNTKRKKKEHAKTKDLETQLHTKKLCCDKVFQIISKTQRYYFASYIMCMVLFYLVYLYNVYYGGGVSIYIYICHYVYTYHILHVFNAGPSLSVSI